MAPVGRPPDPIELKRRRGTLRADRTPNLANLRAVAPMGVDHKRTTAVEAFEQAVDQAPWLAVTDMILVALVRDSLEERDLLGQGVLAGMGDRRELRALNREVLDMLGSLGFTPRERARFGLAEVKADSTLERLRAKREGPPRSTA